MQATMTTKGQLTVPKSIRDKLGLEPGDRVDFLDVDDETVALKRIKKTGLDDLIGCVPYDGPPLTQEDIDNAIMDHAAEEDERIRREASE